jgi:hypothetical protein
MAGVLPFHLVVTSTKLQGVKRNKKQKKNCAGYIGNRIKERKGE